MKERVLKLIIHLGYTATKFADEIGVQRSGISHILSGRNQPSYDFIVKILNKYNDLDAEWLILGKGEMLKPNKHKEIAASPIKSSNYSTKSDNDLFTFPDDKMESQLNSRNNTEKVTYVTIVNRVIILSSDGTFDVYNPAKKD
jgi:transcriptional regulator with XRE-family HTH domain